MNRVTGMHILHGDFESLETDMLIIPRALYTNAGYGL